MISIDPFQVAQDSNANGPKVFLYKISDSIETTATIGVGPATKYITCPSRPDWRGYLQVRNLLMSQELTEDSFLGFFGPRFDIETNISPEQVLTFVKGNAAKTDVMLFCPPRHSGCLFVNVFEQLEVFDPGARATYESVLALADINAPLHDIVMDSRQIVLSNFFVARPSFWREWLKINELIFRISEDPDHPVGADLRRTSNHSGGVQLKVLLQERTASLLLSLDSRWRTLRFSPFAAEPSTMTTVDIELDAVISDALKIAFRDTHDNKYMEAFNHIRQKLIKTRMPSPPRDMNASLKASKLSLSSAVETAEALTAKGMFADALRTYESYLSAPADALSFAGHHNLAILLKGLKRTDEALFHLKLSTELNPTFQLGYLNQGSLLESVGKIEEALRAWQTGLDNTKGEQEADRDYRIRFLNNIGRVKENCRDYPGAESALAASLDIDPHQAPVLHHWIHLRQKQCRWPVLADRLTASQITKYASPLTILSLTDNPGEQFACAQRFVSEKVSVHPRMVPSGHRYRNDRIRIGYLSSDLCMHAVSLLTVQLFEMHNRAKFEVYAFCWSVEDRTQFRERVKNSFDKFYPIGDLTDEAAAELIQKNQIDVLIDLQGLSGRARPEIISRGPSPIQISWLGYPGTTAIPNNDYVIADDFVLPTNLEPFFSEKPLRLPRVFQISDTTRAFGPTRPRSFYGLPDDAFVFCAFNNNYKITPKMFESWMRILKGVPNSILWLLEDNKWARENLLKFSIDGGIDPHRIHFAGRIDPVDYLTRFKTADLFLDTTPYNAGTTANDALWAGLPLITLSGRSYVARMAGSLLRCAGLQDLICYTQEEYEHRAIHLGTNPEELLGLRSRLRSLKDQDALFNSVDFVNEFECEIQKLVGQACADN